MIQNFITEGLKKNLNILKSKNIRAIKAYKLYLNKYGRFIEIDFRWKLFVSICQR